MPSLPYFTMDGVVDRTAYYVVVVFSIAVVGGCLLLIWKLTAPPAVRAHPLPSRLPSWARFESFERNT